MDATNTAEPAPPTSPEPAARWVSAKQLKLITGLSTSWLLEEAAARRLPHIRQGRRVLFDREGSLRVLEETATTRVSVEDALAARFRR